MQNDVRFKLQNYSTQKTDYITGFENLMTQKVEKDENPSAIELVKELLQQRRLNHELEIQIRMLQNRLQEEYNTNLYQQEKLRVAISENFHVPLVVGQNCFDHLILSLSENVRDLKLNKMNKLDSENTKQFVRLHGERVADLKTQTLLNESLLREIEIHKATIEQLSFKLQTSEKTNNQLNDKCNQLNERLDDTLANQHVIKSQNALLSFMNKSEQEKKPELELFFAQFFELCDALEINTNQKLQKMIEEVQKTVLKRGTCFKTIQPDEIGEWLEDVLK
ncbi:Hypothetical_protein [Hexamita inflata]|uniref:Hypothetical_protein n=1 Tax=Hexamita inflata TaxID=28002 RepID=A0AA86QIJ3_9EUKA|nr:Hypothetical protein HINF_LOCUS47015 [Hexamita inflata]